MLNAMQPGDFASLRICVSAGETLPKPTWEAWHAATGIAIMDGIGSTEMLHIFIGAPVEKIRPGATGIPVPGYQAKLIDEQGNDLPRGSTGLLAVRGPTGCRYLADPRQTQYVRNGWNITGDTYHQDEDGYFWFLARSDDMIVSSGYNISGPEVEAALLTHPAVAECGVVAAPDAARGMIVKAYVVLRDPRHRGDRHGAGTAGPREGRDRTLQISACDRVRAVAAADRHRQAATLRATSAGSRCSGLRGTGTLAAWRDR